MISLNMDRAKDSIKKTNEIKKYTVERNDIVFRQLEREWM